MMELNYLKFIISDFKVQFKESENTMKIRVWEDLHSLYLKDSSS